MFRRTILFLVLALTFLGLAGCSRHNKRVTNPLANLGSKQPDKVLFDRAMDQMKHNKFDQARILLQTLINTYPDSEYIARAKLAVGDSWYAEVGKSVFSTFTESLGSPAAPQATPTRQAKSAKVTRRMADSLQSNRTPRRMAGAGIDRRQ